MSLTREDILQAQDLPVETVDVPEWGGTVRVRAMNAEEALQYSKLKVERDEKGVPTGANEKLFMAALVALSVVDEIGNRLFTVGDAEALAEKNGAAVSRLFEAANRLSKANPTPQDMEETEKN